MAQFLRPDGDVSTGSWATAPLWQKIDEASASDADFIQSGNNPTNDTAEVSLSDATDPGSSSGHVIRYRYRKTGGKTANIEVLLIQGTTTIASQTHSNIGTAFTDGSLSLSGAQADSITDYNDLRLRFIGNASGGGSATTVEVSWGEVEVPDAAASQQISPSGLASGEAFGTARADLQAAPSGVASGEAFGTATATAPSRRILVSYAAVLVPGGQDQTTIAPSSVASSEAFGVAVAAGPLTASGIASGEATGTAQVDLQIVPATAGTGEAFGDSAVSSGFVVQASAIASAETFGTAQVHQNITATGIPSAEAFGTTDVGSSQTLTCPSITSAEGFGTARLDQNIVASGVASSESVGAPVLALSITAAGIATGEQVGALTLGLFIVPTPASGGETFGTASVQSGQAITGTGIASAFAFGEVNLGRTDTEASAASSLVDLSGQTSSEGASSSVSAPSGHSAGAVVEQSSSG